MKKFIVRKIKFEFLKLNAKVCEGVYMPFLKNIIWPFLHKKIYGLVGGEEQAKVLELLVAEKYNINILSTTDYY